MSIYVYNSTGRRFEISIESARAVIYNTAQWIPATDVNNNPAMIRTWNITDIVARSHGDEAKLKTLIGDYSIDAGYPQITRE